MFLICKVQVFCEAVSSGHHGYCVHELTEVVITYTRLVQDQTSREFRFSHAHGGHTRTHNRAGYSPPLQWHKLWPLSGPNSERRQGWGGLLQDTKTTKLPRNPCFKKPTQQNKATLNQNQKYDRELWKQAHDSLRGRPEWTAVKGRSVRGGCGARVWHN